MHFCVYLLMVLSVTLSLAKEKRFSGESSDKSSNNPFMWMMMRQLDRTATKLDKVHSLSHQNHVAINNIKGMLEKDKMKAIEPKVHILEDCCKKQKKQITSLESNVLTQGRECRSIEKNATFLLNEFRINMKGMQSKIERAIEPKVQSLEDCCKKQKKQITSLESNVITQGRECRSIEKNATSLLNEFRINTKGMQSKIEKAIEPKFKSLEDCCKKQKKQITSLESNIITQGRECRSIEKKATSLLNEFQMNMKGMQSKIEKAIEPKVQSLEDLCKKQKKQITSLESNVITQGRKCDSIGKTSSSLLNEFQRNTKGMQSKIEKAIEPKVQSLEDLCKKQKKQITSLESNVITQGRECRSIEKKTTSLLNKFQRNMKDMQSEIDDLKKRCSSYHVDLMSFAGHYYWFVYTNVSWNIAKTECEKKGGYLAKVESGAENSWLISALKAEVWIGLNDIQREGQWKWVSDNTGISFRYWPFPEPNGKTRENCVQYCKERCHMKAYGWNDESCGTQMGFVCEKNL